MNRILFILHLPPPIHGAAMMGKYIYDSKVVNKAFCCSYINLTTATDLESIGKFKTEKFLLFYKLLKQILKTVRNFKPNLVYITPNSCGLAFYKDFIVVQLLKSMGCQVVAHYHNKGVSTRQNHFIDNILYRIYFRNIKVILLGELLYKDIKKYISRKNAYICPNGIPESKSAPEARKHDRQPARILFLSNLIESKGVSVLLDALALLKTQGLSFSCHYVGGETTEYNSAGLAEQIKKRNLTKEVAYLGVKTKEEKEEEFRNTDIFVFPTYNEAFGLVLLEAMQQQVPCISTPEGSIPEIVDNGTTGFIVPQKSPEALADKIKYLINHPEEGIEMGQRGYEKYKREYTLEVFEGRLTTILQNILNGKEAC